MVGKARGPGRSKPTKAASTPVSRPATKASPGSASKHPTKSNLRPLRVAVLCSGRGSNLQSLLGHIKAKHVNARVTLVVSDKEDAGALELARRAGVPAVVALPTGPDEKGISHNARLLQILLAEAPELIVLAGYMRIIGRTVLAAFPHRIINIHPSLLPSFRGLHAVQQAHAAGVRIAGCTTHFVTGDLDGGPIILQGALDVWPKEALEHLQKRILGLEHLILPRTVELMAEGRVRIDHGRATITPGPSWLERRGIDLVSGALYSEGF